MKSVYVVYMSDGSPREPDRHIIGIATNNIKAISICKAQAKKDGKKLGAQQIENLLKIKETQYTREWDFVIEEFETNTLL
jgi:hypothetical protein